MVSKKTELIVTNIVSIVVAIIGTLGVTTKINNNPVNNNIVNVSPVISIDSVLVPQQHNGEWQTNKQSSNEDRQGPVISFNISTGKNGTTYGSESLIGSIIEIDATDIETGGNGVKNMSIRWNDEPVEIRNGFKKIFTKLKTGTLHITATDYAGSTSSAIRTYNAIDKWADWGNEQRPTITIELDSNKDPGYEMYDINGKLNGVKVTAASENSDLKFIECVWEELTGNTAVYTFDSGIKDGSCIIQFPTAPGTYTLHAYSANANSDYSMVASKTFTIVDNR